MIVGEKIKTHNKHYTIVRKIAADDRPNANVYLCTDEKGTKFIAKHFYKHPPQPNIPYGKKNHYGRRRDGSDKVFNEIKDKHKFNDFVIDHIERINHKGKWVIIIEYIEGDLLREFILKNKSDLPKVYSSVIALAKTLAEWHQNGFAHGDPHLDNCIVQTNDNGELKAVLIDYSQIHHRDFYYCKKYDCFGSNPQKRIKEDLINNCNKLGKGFRSEIVGLEKQISLDTYLSELFDKHYTDNLKLSILN
jgi:serine/threonine protein kinase